MRKRTTILINGKEYRSIDEAPEHFRTLLRGQIEEAMKTPGKTVTIEKTFEIPLGQLSAEDLKDVLPSGGTGSGANMRFALNIKAGRGTNNSFSIGALGWIVAAIAIAALLYLL